MRSAACCCCDTLVRSKYMRDRRGSRGSDVRSAACICCRLLAKSVPISKQALTPMDPFFNIFNKKLFKSSPISRFLKKLHKPRAGKASWCRKSYKTVDAACEMGATYSFIVLGPLFTLCNRPCLFVGSTVTLS